MQIILKYLALFLVVFSRSASSASCGFSILPKAARTLADSGVCVTDSFEAGCNAYGFAFSSDWYPLKTPGFLCGAYAQTDHDELQYQTDIEDILLRNKNAWNVYCYAYRVVQTAYQPGRNPGFLGIGSYGDNWFARGIRVTADLNEEYNYALTDWSPQNVPKNGSYNVGISFGTSGFQVSMPLQINQNELSIESLVKLPTRHFEINYSVMGFSEYSMNSLCLYGMFVFATPTTPYREPYISVKFESRYFGQAYHGLVQQDSTRAL